MVDWGGEPVPVEVTGVIGVVVVTTPAGRSDWGVAVTIGVLVGITVEVLKSSAWTIGVRVLVRGAVAVFKACVIEVDVLVRIAVAVFVEPGS
jgi:hypothetical protein